MAMDVGTINKAERKYLLSRALFSKINFFILLALILGLLFIDYQYVTDLRNLEHERRQLERKRLEADRKNEIQALKRKQQR